MNFTRSAMWCLGTAALLSVAGCSLARRAAGTDRVYRIGWEEVPPFQVKAADGTPTGFAVELVRKAAQRRGIRLEWVYHPASSEDALRRKLVDLWPLITMTPERMRFLHFTAPYLQHDHSLVVRADSTYRRPQDLAREAVSYQAIPINEHLLRSVLPDANLLPAATQRESIEAVCLGHAAAAFVEEYTGIYELLGGAACGHRPLRMIWIPSLRTSVAIGSTFASSGVADRIRDEMNSLAGSDELQEIMARWGYDSPQNMATVNAMLDEKAVERRLIATAAGFATLAIIALLVADRMRRQSNRIRRAVAERERAETVSREWERRFRDLLEGTQLVAVMVDPHGAITFCNDYVCSITGWRREEFVGHAAEDFLDTEYLATMQEAMQSAAARRSLPGREGAILAKNGEWRRIQWTSTVLRDPGGRTAGFAGLGEDVTELQRLRAETAIRECEERFRTIFQHAAIGVAQLDPEGRILVANDQFHAMLGYAPGELTGASLSSRACAEDVEALRKHAARLAAGEISTFSMEARYIRKDGATAWCRLSMSALLDPDNRPVHFVAVVEDITERKHAEAALRESEERFRTMADTAPVMIWVAGPDKKCTFFNKPWLTFTGRTLEEEMGDGWATGVHADDLGRCWETYATAFDARRAFQMEYRLRSADGSYRWIRDEGVPRFEPDGSFAGYIGSCIDVTDARRAQEEALARQKLECIGVLAGGIAHRFNNLLGSILASTQLALADVAPGSPAHEELLRINTVSMGAAAIVSELLVYAGKENKGFEPIEISTVVSEMLQLLRVSISKQATFQVDLARDLPLVQGNASQIRQVVMNLVTNASEALGEKAGVITITTSKAACPRAANGNGKAPSADGVRLEISDTGCGMTQEVVARMFDPYFTTKFAGRGLGLAAVQGIVRGHRGTIQTISSPGQGTCFEILLPSIQEPSHTLPAPAEEPDCERSTAPRPGTVLVIEDETALRITVSKILRKHGFSVIEAGDGMAGIELFRANANEVGVILLDMTLPGLSGPDVLAELQRIRPRVRVIVTTAYSEDTVLAAFRKEEVWRFVRKPYHMSELLALIGDAAAAHG